MTYLSKYHTKDLNTLLKGIHQYSVGMDDIFHRLEAYGGTNMNYPPYNIIRENSNKWKLEMALAGWDKNSIEVTTENNILTVRSKDNTDAEASGEYVHRGVATRSFSRGFTLSDDVEIGNVEFKNGMLTVYMNKIMPDHMKRKVYDIL